MQSLPDVLQLILRSSSLVSDSYSNHGPFHSSAAQDERALLGASAEDGTAFDNYVPTTVDSGWMFFILAIVISIVSVLMLPLNVKVGKHIEKKIEEMKSAGTKSDPSDSSSDDSNKNNDVHVTSHTAITVKSGADDDQDKDQSREGTYATFFALEIQNMWKLFMSIIRYDQESKQLVKLAVPFTLTSILQSATRLIQLGLISQYLGTTAAIAYAIVDLTVGTTTAILGGFTSALMTLASVAYGAENVHAAGQYVQLSAVSYVLGQIPFFFLWGFLIENIVLLFGFSEETARLASRYVWVVLPKDVSEGVKKTVMELLKVTDHEMYASVFDCVASGVDALLTWGVLTFSDADLVVLGLCYLGSNVFFMILNVIICIKCGWFAQFKDGMIKSNAFKNRAMVKEFFKTSLPLSIADLLCYAEWELLVGFASTLGSGEAACWAILGYAWDVFESTTLSFADAGEVRVAHLLGAGSPQDAKLSAYKSIFMGLITSMLMSIIFISMINVLPEFLTTDETLQDMLRMLFPIVAFSNVAMSVGMTCWSLVGAQLRYALATAIGYSCSFVVTLPLGAILTIWLNYDLRGLTFAVVVGYIMRGMLLTTVLLMSDWEKLSEDARETMEADEPKSLMQRSSSSRWGLTRRTSARSVRRLEVEEDVERDIWQKPIAEVKERDDESGTKKGLYNAPVIEKVDDTLLPQNISTHHTDLDEEKYDAVLVGAGWAGISAAKALLKNGINNILVLEANDYIGGRSKSVNLDGSINNSSMHGNYTNVPIDLGSEWLFPENDLYHNLISGGYLRKGDLKEEGYRCVAAYLQTVVQEKDDKNEKIARPLELTTERLADEKVKELYDQVWDGFEEYIEEYKRDNHNGSIGHAAEKYKAEKLTNDLEVQAMDLMIIDAEVEYAGDRNEISIFDEEHNESDPTLNYLSIPGVGFGNTAAKFATPFADKIRLESKVTGIDYSNSGNATISFLCNGVESKVTAKTVLVTVSLGVLKAGSIKFTPSLPDSKQEAISSMGWGLLNKCILQWNDPKAAVWPEKEWLELLTPSDDEGKWVHFYNPTPHKGVPMLVGFTAAKNARNMETQTDDEVLADVMVRLKSMFPTISTPDRHIITRWGSEENNIHGSYSFEIAGRDFFDDSWDLRERVENVWFAGEATSSDWYGTTVGASESGEVAAKEMLRVINPTTEAPGRKMTRSASKMLHRSSSIASRSRMSRRMSAHSVRRIRV